MNVRTRSILLAVTVTLGLVSALSAAGPIQLHDTGDTQRVEICAGESVVLTVDAAGSNLTYQWYKDGIPIEGATTAGYTATQSGVYTCKVHGDCGDVTSDPAEVVVKPLPEAPIASANPPVILVGDSSTLTASGGSGDDLLWSLSCHGPVIGIGGSIIVSPLVTTTYYAWWHNSCGDSVCASVTVQVGPLPVPPDEAVASPDTIYAGMSSTLTAVGGSGDELRWSTSCHGLDYQVGNGISVSPLVTTTYYAWWHNAYGDSACVSVKVEVGEYKVGVGTFDWIDPTSHPTIPLSDNASASRSLGYTFYFYGQPYTSVYVGSNGLLGFSSSGMTSYSNRCIPYYLTPNSAIYAFWDNLNPASGGGSVRMQVIGLPPNRQAVVSWVGVPSNYASTAKFTFQAILYEGTNDIVFQYLNTAYANLSYGRGKSATIGIENQTGSKACQFSCNTPSLTDRMALLFTYQPPQPTLSVTPPQGVSAEGFVGGPIPESPQGYLLENTGAEPLNWTLSHTQPWVTLSTPDGILGGTLAPGAQTTVTVSINSEANNLEVGTHSDRVTFTNTTNGRGSTTRDVTLTIKPITLGMLSVTPEEGLISQGPVGGPFTLPDKIYTLENTGGTPLTWSASKTQPWVTLSTPSGSLGGTLVPGAKVEVTVSINSAARSLPAQTDPYADTISFNNTTDVTRGSTTRPVSLTVSPLDYRIEPRTYDWIDPAGHPVITLSDNSVSTARSLGFPFEFYGTLYNSIYIGSNGLLGFSSSGMTKYANTNIPNTITPNSAIYPFWDNLNPASGGGSVRMEVIGLEGSRQAVVSWVGVPSNYASTAKFTFQAILCEGTNDIIFQYLNTAAANATYGGGKSATIGIENQTGTKACKWSYNTKSVSDGQALRFTRRSMEPIPPTLSVSPPQGMTAEGVVGGPIAPSPQDYLLENTGDAPLDWTASKTQPWVGLSATSGTLAAHTTTIVTVSINSEANGLGVGTYSDTVSFANTTNGNRNTTRDVTLTINSITPGMLTVTPADGLISEGFVGGPFIPPSKEYTLANTGGTSLDWTATKTLSCGASATPESGTLPPGASVTVTVSMDSCANALPPGTYTDTISFTNSSNGAGSTTRSVSLTVNPRGYRWIPTTYSWIDPTSHSAITLSDNSVSSARPLGFSFDFYGTPYSSIYVTSNGLLGFSSSWMTVYTNVCIPNSARPNSAIYPYWDNLNPASGGGSVRMGTSGIAPNRKVVVSWVGVPSNFASTAKFTFQAILCEGTNDIIFQYLNAALANASYGGGRSATIGIENQTGTDACQYSCNTRSITADSTALLFTMH